MIESIMSLDAQLLKPGIHDHLVLKVALRA
jgi:hypothetical protein